MKCLVVDDTKQMAEIHVQIIKLDLNIECMIANTGKQALQLANLHDFTIFLLDMNLPDLTGLQIGKELYDLINKPKIIFITSEDEYSVKQKARMIGAVGYFIKSVNFKKLVWRLQDLLIEDKC